MPLPQELSLPLALFVAYLIGSIPFAVISSRLFGLADPRSYGSKNPGATNVLRSGNKAAAALTLLAELLGGNPTTSVFARELQFKRGVATWSAAFYDGTSVDPENFGVYVMPTPGTDLAQAEAAMDEVIAGFQHDGVNAEDLNRIKAQVGGATIYARDNAGGLARSYGQALAVGLTVQDVQEWPDILQSITAEEIMTAAAEVFDKNRAVTGWLQAPAPVDLAEEAKE